MGFKFLKQTLGSPPLRARTIRKSIPSTDESSVAEEASTECSSNAVAKSITLGSGIFSESTGSVESLIVGFSSPAEEDAKNRDEEDSPASWAPPRQESAREFSRVNSSFLRVADLDMSDSEHKRKNSSNTEQQEEEGGGAGGIPNFDHSSPHPPPGMEMDDVERWVALDDGKDGGTHAPIAPAAIQALATMGLETALTTEIWTPADAWKTSKLSKKPENSSCCWTSCTFDLDKDIPEANHNKSGDHHDVVLVWSGKVHSGFYGSDLPAVRAAAIIDMSAQDLMELLVDSSRVAEYNAMSLGRKDLSVLQSDFGSGPFGGVTKVICSESRPPMLRKTLRFTSLFHARTLPGGSSCGYQLVTRAVSNTDSSSSPSDHHHVLVSEILLGVNIIRRINDSQCLFVSVNHIRSPMVPMMIAKRLGLQAAINFIHDVRKCC